MEERLLKDEESKKIKIRTNRNGFIEEVEIDEDEWDNETAEEADVDDGSEATLDLPELYEDDEEMELMSEEEYAKKLREKTEAEAKKQEKCLETLKKADDAYQAGDYASAEKLYDEVLSIEKNTAKAHWGKVKIVTDDLNDLSDPEKWTAPFDAAVLAFSEEERIAICEEYSEKIGNQQKNAQKQVKNAEKVYKTAQAKRETVLAAAVKKTRTPMLLAAVPVVVTVVLAVLSLMYLLDSQDTIAPVLFIGACVLFVVSLIVWATFFKKFAVASSKRRANRKVNTSKEGRILQEWQEFSLCLQYAQDKLSAKKE